MSMRNFKHRRPRLAIGLLRIVVLLSCAGIVAAGGRYAYVMRVSSPVGAEARALAGDASAFVNAAGADVHYVSAGPQGAPVVILLHGLLGSSANFAALVDDLAAQGFRLIALDRPPFGLSDKRADLNYTLDGQGDVVVGLMDALGIQRATLLGHSAGGPVAVNVALRFPERVEKLVLVSAQFTIDTQGVEAGEASGVTENPALPFVAAFLLGGANPSGAWAAAEMRAAFSDARVQTFQRANYFPPREIDAEFAMRLVAFTRVAGWEQGFIAYGRTFANDPTRAASNQVARVSQSTLVIWCKQDRLVSAAVSRALVQQIRGAVAAEYDGCGHVPWEERPAEFVRDVVAFLRRAA